MGSDQIVFGASRRRGVAHRGVTRKQYIAKQKGEGMGCGRLCLLFRTGIDTLPADCLARVPEHYNQYGRTLPVQISYVIICFML